MEIRVAELEATIHNTTDCLSTADDRIKELEADNASLLESVDRSLSVSVNFEGLYTTSQSRNTELECRLRQYDHQLPIAEDLVAKLETELCENNQVVDAAHARLTQSWRMRTSDWETTWNCVATSAWSLSASTLLRTSAPLSWHDRSEGVKGKASCDSYRASDPEVPRLL